jgi:Ras-related protein Rab-18
MWQRKPTHQPKSSETTFQQTRSKCIKKRAKSSEPKQQSATWQQKEWKSCNETINANNLENGHGTLDLFSKKMSEEAITFKLLLIGDSGTGKSSLLLRFTDDLFLEEEMSSTIGVDFKVKWWAPPASASIGSNRVKLTLWDTAGQERFRTLTSSYYRGAHGVILVYDVTNRESFEHLRDTWLQELDTYAGDTKPIKMVVGNKIDRVSERVVNRQEGLKFAQENGALFIESSAKTTVGVQQAFEELCLKVAETPDLWQAKSARNNLNLQQQNASSDTCAC